MARPPIGERTMTNAERQKRYRDRKRAAAQRKASKADWQRNQRAAERAAAAGQLPAAPEMPVDLVGWCSSLVVTQGEGAGELLTLLEWEAAFLRSVEASGGAEIGLSVPAGAGKTTLAAAIAAAGVAGPLAQPRAVVLLVAASFTQALIGFDHALAFLEPLTEADPDRWRVLRSEQAALIEDRETGAVLRAREANARTLHGPAPSAVVADEPAQWQPTQRDALYSAIRSRLGKIPGARLLAIGTKPDDPSHWFCRLLQRNGVTYAATADDDPFDPATWAAANPSLAHFPALRQVYEREAAEAQADPSLVPAFKALRLNLGTADHEIAVLIEADAWQRCEAELLPAADGPLVLAFDLSGGDAMAAAAAYWPRCGRLEARAAFPAVPDLCERGRVDGADYQRMHDDGDLLVMGRRVVPVAELVNEALRRWGRPARIVADYHQQRELLEALEAAKFPPAALVATGMGWRDSPGRIRDFRRSVKGGRVWCAPRLLIRQALANARIQTNSMGDSKIIKGGASGRRRTARDDVAVAAVLAISEGARMPADRPRRRRVALAG